jgi:hypothetical protein
MKSGLCHTTVMAMPHHTKAAERRHRVELLDQRNLAFVLSWAECEDPVLNREYCLMKRFLALALTGMLMAFGGPALTAQAAPVSQAAEMVKTAKSSTVNAVEEVRHRRYHRRHHWRHRHYRCRRVYRCWRTYYGHRRCGWVRRCRY